VHQQVDVLSCSAVNVVREEAAYLPNSDLIDAMLDPAIGLVSRIPIQRVDVPQNEPVSEFRSDSVDHRVMRTVWRAEQLLLSEKCSDDIFSPPELIPNIRLAKARHISVRVGVITDTVARLKSSPDKPRMRFGIPAENKERRLDLVAVESFQNRIGMARMRAVIERKPNAFR
jgi:hypothetical protein